MEQSNTSFFLSNNMEACTISRLIKGIQLLACKLGTEFTMLCTIYYPLCGSEMFSDFLFLQVVTVLLKNNNEKFRSFKSKEKIHKKEYRGFGY